MLLYVWNMCHVSITGLLVTASQHTDNSYHYNTIMAVLATEVTKLVVSFTLYIKE